MPLLPKTKILTRCITKRCSVLHKILFYSLCHLLHRKELVFKNPPVPLFPQVPHDVYHQAVEIATLILVHHLCRCLPPITFCKRNLQGWSVGGGPSAPKTRPGAKLPRQKGKVSIGASRFLKAHCREHIGFDVASLDARGCRSLGFYFG